MYIVIFIPRQELSLLINISVDTELLVFITLPLSVEMSKKKRTCARLLLSFNFPLWTGRNISSPVNGRKSLFGSTVVYQTKPFSLCEMFSPFHSDVSQSGDRHAWRVLLRTVAPLRTTYLGRFRSPRPAQQNAKSLSVAFVERKI